MLFRSVLDQQINDRGVPINIEAAKGVIKTVEEYSKRLLDEAVQLTGGEVTTMKSPTQIKKWLLSKGIEVDSVDKASVAYLLTLDLPDDVRRFLEIRQTLGKSSVAKYQSMIACASNRDNRVRGVHAFAGAQTGRWCIEEGSLILIKQRDGVIREVPIENVSLTDMVWDGNEWVEIGRAHV